MANDRTLSFAVAEASKINLDSRPGRTGSGKDLGLEDAARRFCTTQPTLSVPGVRTTVGLCESLGIIEHGKKQS